MIDSKCSYEKLNKGKTVKNKRINMPVEKVNIKNLNEPSFKTESLKEKVLSIVSQNLSYEDLKKAFLPLYTKEDGSEMTQSEIEQRLVEVVHIIEESLDKDNVPKGLEESEKMRVSVANLVRRIKVKETGEVIYFAVSDKKKTKWQALGGGLQVKEHFKSLLESLGAEFLESKSDANDARFKLDVSRFGMISILFSELLPEHAEADPVRELVGELTQETYDGQSILDKDDLQDLKYSYIGTVSQLPQGGVVTERAEKVGIPTRRIFNHFEIELPQEVVNKMKSKKDLVKFFDIGELELAVETNYKLGDRKVADNLFTRDF